MSCSVFVFFGVALTHSGSLLFQWLKKIGVSSYIGLCYNQQFYINNVFLKEPLVVNPQIVIKSGSFPLALHSFSMFQLIVLGSKPTT